MKPSRMATLLFFSSILFYWFQPTIQFLARRRFLKQARFVLDVLHQLSVTPFQTYNVSDSFDCTFKCIEHDQCLSFNMAVNSTGGFKVCQLLSTDKYNSSTDLRPSTEFHYYSIDIGLIPAHLSPCNAKKIFQRLYWIGSYTCTCPTNTSGNNCEWEKLNSNPVHVESKGRKFGVFKVHKSGQILKLKLVHISGGMTCYVNVRPITNFGCGSALSMIITDANDQVISPNSSYISATGTYSLPGVTSNDKELILPEIDPPLHVTAGQEFRLWYGDDYYKYFTADNTGTLQVDVHALYK